MNEPELDVSDIDDTMKFYWIGSEPRCDAASSRWRTMATDCLTTAPSVCKGGELE